MLPLNRISYETEIIKSGEQKSRNQKSIKKERKNQGFNLQKSKRI